MTDGGTLLAGVALEIDETSELERDFSWTASWIGCGEEWLDEGWMVGTGIDC